MTIKNKIGFKKCLVVVIIVGIASIILDAIVFNIEYRFYRKNFNLYVGGILEKVRDKYPEISTEELIDILNNKSSYKSNILKVYGIDIDEEAAVLKNDELHASFIIHNAIMTGMVVLAISIVYIVYIISKEKKINDITLLIEKINRGDYSIDVSTMSEDELSILRDELYKTTIMLREQKEQALEGRETLKKSLEDISHQLKTPLASMSISLDNLIDNPNMDDEHRGEFLRSLNREVGNMNFLIQTLLKLSRLDTGTVSFIERPEKVKSIVEASIENVSVLADLKGIDIVIQGEIKRNVICDFRWQVEAFSNIVKNAIEHAESGSTVKIRLEENKIYAKVSIHNNGIPIDKDDLPHIFERFYRGKNAGAQSVGIGLSLAKSIISKSGGSLEVESDRRETVFIVKYYKRKD